jgi:hypothetical protein
VKCKTVVKSLKKCGISNAVDGTEDEVLFGGSKSSDDYYKNVFHSSDGNFKGFYD